MRFTTSGLLRGAAAACATVLLAYIVLRLIGVVGDRPDLSNPDVLAQQAIDNLEKVKQRKPGDRRPASYDSVMAPLDRLLSLARDTLDGEEYDPVADYEKIRSYALPVIEVATQAAAQARTETGPLVKEYRFNDQKGEACQYLANAMWERILAGMPRQTGFIESQPSYPAAAMNELKNVLDLGIAATQENASLYYIRGVVNRAEGLWVASARDLARAVAIDANMASAWNVLGLVRINLKEFDQAEEALERAKALLLAEAQTFNRDPGVEYTTIIYNLALFHERLAAHYTQENRITPTVESQRLLAKHSIDARKYLEEFLNREPASSPDARDAARRLEALGR